MRFRGPFLRRFWEHHIKFIVSIYPSWHNATNIWVCCVMDERRCDFLGCSRHKRVNQCACGMCLGFCESPEWSITYPAEFLARRVRSRKRGRESKRNVKWFLFQSALKYLCPRCQAHLLTPLNSLSFSVSSLSLILFSIFVIPHWALISFSHLFFPPFTRLEQSNKKWPKHKRTKDKWVGMKTGKAKRGEKGDENRKEEREGVRCHGPPRTGKIF